MSKKRRKPESGDLQLPSPRSSRALDEKILAHARANAPSAKRSFPAAWAGGMATTAVLVVAVYLTTISDSGKQENTVMKEESAFAGAAPQAAPQRMAQHKAATMADVDALESVPLELEALQAPPAAEAAAISARAKQMEIHPTARPNVEDTLKHLRELVQQGKIEEARRGYVELRNACSECGLPPTLQRALENLQPDPPEH